ncbi:unnamed protein product, partial [Larinioides sclopetarius]
PSCRPCCQPLRRTSCPSRQPRSPCCFRCWTRCLLRSSLDRCRPSGLWWSSWTRSCPRRPSGLWWSSWTRICPCRPCSLWWCYRTWSSCRRPRSLWWSHRAWCFSRSWSSSWTRIWSWIQQSPHSLKCLLKKGSEGLYLAKRLLYCTVFVENFDGKK